MPVVQCRRLLVGEEAAPRNLTEEDGCNCSDWRLNGTWECVLGMLVLKVVELAGRVDMVEAFALQGDILLRHMDLAQLARGTVTTTYHP
jgi:hypothetical protein